MRMTAVPPRLTARCAVRVARLTCIRHQRSPMPTCPGEAAFVLLRWTLPPCLVAGFYFRSPKQPQRRPENTQVSGNYAGIRQLESWWNAPRHDPRELTPSKHNNSDSWALASCLNPTPHPNTGHKFWRFWRSCAPPRNKLFFARKREKKSVGCWCKNRGFAEQDPGFCAARAAMSAM